MIVIKKYNLDKLNKDLKIYNIDLDTLDLEEKEQFNINLNVLLDLLFDNVQKEIFNYHYEIKHNLSYRKIQQKIGLTYQACKWNIDKMIERLTRKNIFEMLLNGNCVYNEQENLISINREMFDLSNPKELPIEFLKLNKTTYNCLKEYFGLIFIEEIFDKIKVYSDFLKCKTMGIKNVEHLLERLNVLNVNYEECWGKYNRNEFFKNITNKYYLNKKEKKING